MMVTTPVEPHDGDIHQRAHMLVTTSESPIEEGNNTLEMPHNLPEMFYIDGDHRKVTIKSPDLLRTFHMHNI